MQDIRSYYALGSAFLLYLLSCLIVLFDHSFDFRWYAFALWMCAIVLCLYAHRSALKQFIPGVPFSRDPSFWFIVFLCISRFLFLDIYPFNGMGDSIRDGGLRAQQFALGRWFHLFGFDWSQGLTLASLLSPLYFLFDGDILLIRIPSAILSAIDILLVYSLLKRYFGIRQAFFGALAMVCCQYHWYYARTEMLIGCTSFFTTIFIFLLSELIRKFNWACFALTGFFAGFSLGFHASVWIMTALTVFVSIIICFVFLRKNLGKFAGAIIPFAASGLIGYGPRLIFAFVFYLGFRANPNGGYEEELMSFFERYWISLKVIFINITPAGHFPGHVFFTFAAGFLILFGAISSLYKPKWISIFPVIFSIFILLLIPLTNGALGDKPGTDYRLFPIIPAASILIGCGMGNLLAIFSYKNIFALKCCGAILALAFTVEEVRQLAFGFTSEMASDALKKSTVDDYQVTYAVNLIKKYFPDVHNKDICFITGPEDEEYFKLMHIADYINFLLPHTKIANKVFQKADGGPDHVWSIYFGACPDNINGESWKALEFCKEYRMYVCPPDKSKFTLRIPAEFYKE
jgi:hypothetical protein